MPLRFPLPFFRKSGKPAPKEAAPILEGQCACGAVEYHLTAKPMFVNCCHCRECQRHTGSAFVLNGIIETAHIKQTSGIVVPFAVWTTSGAAHDIYHCAECQTALWSDYGRRPGIRFLRIGTLNAPERCPPDAHIFVESKAPWLALDNSIPKFNEFYDIEAIWPPESVERRTAARAITNRSNVSGTDSDHG